MSKKVEPVKYGDNHFARVDGILHPISKARFDELADKCFESTVTATPPTPAPPKRAAAATPSQQAAQAVPAIAKGPSVGDRIMALCQQNPGMDVAAAARQAAKENPQGYLAEYGSLPKAAAPAPPAPQAPRVRDRIMALVTQEKIPVEQAVKRIQAEDPALFARYQRGEDV